MDPLQTMANAPLPTIITIAVLLLVIALPIITLVSLFRARDIPILARLLWVPIILAFPLIGPALFAISRFVRAGIDRVTATGPNQSTELHTG